jgi:hypothetical protein
MLSGDKDVIYSNWLNVSILKFFIFNNNLRFAIWSQPWDASILSLNCHFFADLVGKDMRVWVECLGIPFISSISEHKSLITSSHIEFIFVGVNTISNLT